MWKEATKKIDQKAVTAMIDNYRKMKEEEDKIPLGRSTEIRCGCGGFLHKFDGSRVLLDIAKKEAGRPRYSRKKRLRKKFEKQWRAKPATRRYLMQLLVQPLRNPMGFKCASCGARRGFYQAVAGSMFKIEPMPEGGEGSTDE